MSAIILCPIISRQLASMGTFQVLKLPLGFIRVLEWVSWNFICFVFFPFSIASINNSRKTIGTMLKNAMRRMLEKIDFGLINSRIILLQIYHIRWILVHGLCDGPVSRAQVYVMI